MTSFSTASRENFAPAGCLHARAEPVSAQAARSVGLVGALHGMTFRRIEAHGNKHACAALSRSRPRFRCQEAFVEEAEVSLVTDDDVVEHLQSKEIARAA